jgi:hypothetical protein
LLLLDHLLEELLCHLLSLLLLLGFSSFLHHFPCCIIITILDIFITRVGSEDESSELSTLDGVRLGAFSVRSTPHAALSSLS